MKKALILVNRGYTVYNFRRELVKRLLDDGFEVTVSSPMSEGIPELKAMGCLHHEVAVDRHGTNPVTDLKLILTYRKLLREIQPDVVLTYTVKPNIYGGIASMWARIPYIANITGLGGALERAGLLTRFMLVLYRYAMRGVHCIFFQNKTNMDYFASRRIGTGKGELIAGSGVNIEAFPLCAYPDLSEKTTIAYIGRVMRDKGIREFYAAARAIRAARPDVRFLVLGFIDDKEIQEQTLTQAGCEYAGFVHGIQPYLKEAAAVVLPSYHEGMANVLLEAAATGRPVIASRIPGCQETFDEDVTGLGCAAGDAGSLTRAIERFLALTWEEKRQMGLLGRQKMERQFDRKVIVDAYMHRIAQVTGR